MNQKFIPIVSIIIGVVAFFLTLNYIKMKESDIDKLREEMEAKATKVEVMFAISDIPKGTKILAKHLSKKPEYEIRIPKDAVRYGNEAKMILGKKSLFKLKRGDLITWSDIEGGSPDELGLAPQITPGLRAVSMSVGGASAVSSLVLPGDRVDVLGTFSFPSKKIPGEMETVTLTVLQDVTVLATGQTLANQKMSSRSRTGSSSYSTVSVEVSPAEAELLVFAQQMRGRLTLSLRHPDDNKYKPDMPTVDFEYLQTELPRLNKERQTTIRSNSPIR